MNKTFRPLLASILAFSIVLLSPGLPFYQAFASETKGTPTTGETGASGQRVEPVHVDQIDTGVDDKALDLGAGITAPADIRQGELDQRPGELRVEPSAELRDVPASIAPVGLSRPGTPNGAPAQPATHFGGPVASTDGRSYSLPVRLANAAVQKILMKYDLKGPDGWLTLPAYVGVFGALSEVLVMRDKNIHGTRYMTNEAAPVPYKPEYALRYSPTGHYQDLQDPNIGAPGLARGYNVDPSLIKQRPPHPNLITIGVNHLTQDTFKPAPVNVRFGSHLQKNVEGWFGTDLPPDNTPVRLELPAGYAWDEPTMSIRRTPEAPNKKPGVQGPPVYINTESPQWALRSFYGKSQADQDKLRTFENGKVKVGKDGLLPSDPADPRLMAVGQPRNTWIGRAMEDIDDALYHNYLAEGLKRYYEQGIDRREMGWSWLAYVMYRVFDYGKWKVERDMFAAMTPKQQDEWLFQLAWMGNAATNAVYHTTDWTEILFFGSKVLQTGMEIDYSGFLGYDVKKSWHDKPWAHMLLGRIINYDLLSGMAGSKVQRWSGRYDLGNNQFIDAYRIPELVPPNLTFYSQATGQQQAHIDMGELQGFKTLPAMQGLLAQGVTLDDMYYSMGLNSSGDLVANNLAPFFYKLHAMHGETLDRRVRDNFRQDERGSPTINGLRRGMRLPVAKDFLDLTGGDVEKAEQLEKDYNGDIEAVHAHIGKRVAPRPWGVVIPLEDFIIFGLNAPWRFAANRFLSELFVPGVYTPWLINKVIHSSFKTKLLAIRPELAPDLDGVASAYLPWNRLHPQTDPQIDAVEKSRGIATHSAARVAAMGPLAADTLYSNSARGLFPSGTREAQAIFTPVNRTGKLLSGRLSKLWQGRVFERERETEGASYFDGKPSILVDHKATSWLSLFVRDELRQVGPNTYIGRTYFKLPFAKPRLIANFGLDFSDAPATEALHANVETAATSMGMANLKLMAAGLAVAGMAVWFGIDASMTLIPSFVLNHLPSFASSLLAPISVFPSWLNLSLMAFGPLALGFLSWKNRRPAINTLRNVLRLSSRGPKSRARQFKPLFDAESQSMKAARMAKIAAFTVLDVSAMIAWRMFGAHPALAVIAGAIGIGYAVAALLRSRAFAKAVDILRPRYYGLLMKGLPRRDTSSIPGENDIQRRYMFNSEDGSPNVATLQSTFRSLRRIGAPVAGAVSSTLKSHLGFARKTQRGMPAIEKVQEELSFWHINLKNILAAHDENGTGLYARTDKRLSDGTSIKAGDVDMDVFNSWFPAGRPIVTRAEMDSFFEAIIAQSKSGFFTRWISRMAFKTRMDQLFAYFPDMVVYENGKAVKAISREQLLAFFKGSAVYDVADQRAGIMPAQRPQP